MANQEQLKRLRDSIAEDNGCAAWNRWRKDDWDSEGGRYKTAIDLTGADLSDAHLVGADLSDAHLTSAYLSLANLTGADLTGADLTGARLTDADLIGANLSLANLTRANLSLANLTGADLSGARLTDADLIGANLTRANLSLANLSLANLSRANLTGADLTGANLTGAGLIGANLTSANLSLAVFDIKTNLRQVSMDDSHAGLFFGTQWNSVDLTSILWNGEKPTSYESAVQAAQQMTVALRNQGLSERADRFAYQARLAQRRVYRERLPGSVLSYLGSLLLWAISGYGYRPNRTFTAYLLVVGSFAAAYYAVTHTVETQLAKLSWDEALVLSLTSFHGRGFLPGFLALGDWVARIGALEAVIGLFIELILIATFSRRFLGN